MFKFNPARGPLPTRLAFVALLTFSAVGQADEFLGDANGHVGEKIRILNEKGQPIAGADVLIGNEAGQPFANNQLKTDINGAITVGSDWQNPQPITISANGYLRTTFLSVTPEAHDFQLRLIDMPTQIEIKGVATGFGDLRRDGKVDFGLVYPALSRRQLAQFDIDTMISPQFDEIKVLTETVSVPSNLTLPNQEESYILPITLNKPDYRLYVRESGNYRVMATHGQFPLKQVVGQLRDGKSFYEVLNLFKFMECGQRDVVVNDRIDGQDVPVNQVTFNRSVAVRAPSLADGQVMLSATMVNQGDLYFPSDIKRLQSGEQLSLNIPNGDNKNYIVSLLMPKREAEKIGGIHAIDIAKDIDSAAHPEVDLSPAQQLLKPFQIHVGLDQSPEQSPLNDGPGGISIALNTAEDSQPKFLGLVPRPTLQGKNLVNFISPNSVAGVDPVATYVVLSQIDHVKVGNYNLERHYRMWELFSPGWVNVAQLPNMPLNFEPGKNYRWEVYYMGSAQNASLSDGKAYFLDRVTHVSHNSLDL
jgi:hypothetical protein